MKNKPTKGRNYPLVNIAHVSEIEPIPEEEAKPIVQAVKLTHVFTRAMFDKMYLNPEQIIDREFDKLKRGLMIELRRTGII